MHAGGYGSGGQVGSGTTQNPTQHFSTGEKIASGENLKSRKEGKREIDLLQSAVIAFCSFTLKFSSEPSTL